MWCMDLNGLGMFQEQMVKEQQRSYWEGKQEGEKNAYINVNGWSQIGLEEEEEEEEEKEETMMMMFIIINLREHQIYSVQFYKPEQT